MKTMFGVTNALLGRPAPVQLPESSNNVALAESFKQFFVEKIATLRRAINSRAVTTITPDQQTCDYHQTSQFSEFMLATTADIRGIVLQSSAKSCTLCPDSNKPAQRKHRHNSIGFDRHHQQSLESGVVPATMKHAMVT